MDTQKNQVAEHILKPVCYDLEYKSRKNCGVEWRSAINFTQFLKKNKNNRGPQNGKHKNDALTAMVHCGEFKVGCTK